MSNLIYFYIINRKLGIIQDEFDNIKAGYYNQGNQYNGGNNGNNNNNRDIKGNLINDLINL